MLLLCSLIQLPPFWLTLYRVRVITPFFSLSSFQLGWIATSLWSSGIGASVGPPQGNYPQLRGICSAWSTHCCDLQLGLAVMGTALLASQAGNVWKMGKGLEQHVRHSSVFTYISSVLNRINDQPSVHTSNSRQSYLTLRIFLHHLFGQTLVVCEH